MIPFYLLPNLTFSEYILFQLLQTALHFTFFVILSCVGLLLVQKDKTLINIKDILRKGLKLEIMELIISTLSNFTIIGGITAILFNTLATIVAEFLFIYLSYYKKDEISEIKVIFLYIIIMIPAFILSLYLTNLIFALFGVQNALFLKFY